MPALVRSKTWTKYSTTVVYGSGPTPQLNQSQYGADLRKCMFILKERFIDARFTVVSSCGYYSSAWNFGAADHWIDASAVRWKEADNKFGWIVLKSTNMYSVGDGFQLCISLSPFASSSTYNISLYASFGSGFTGGTELSRPVSTNEFCFSNDYIWGAISPSGPGISLNFWYTSDGKIFRFSGPQYINSPTGYYPWLFETLAQPSSWAQPAVVFGKLDSFNKNSIIADPPASYFYCSSWNPTSGFFKVMFTTESIRGGNLSTNSVCQLPDIGNKWPVFPLGVVALSPITPGYMGRLEDIYLVPTALATKDYMPSNGDKHFVVLEDVLLANDGTFIQWY